MMILKCKTVTSASRKKLKKEVKKYYSPRIVFSPHEIATKRQFLINFTSTQGSALNTFKI